MCDYRTIIMKAGLVMDIVYMNKKIYKLLIKKS